jgi:predicted aspartyl protease
MATKRSAIKLSLWSYCRRGLVLAALVVFPFLAPFASGAISCPVLAAQSPTEADTALLASDFVKAAALYKSALSQHPDDFNLTAGLVHSLLRQQKLEEAAEVVKTALEANPKSAALITLRGEVEMRQGTPWTVEQTVIESYKLDPCNPRTHLLFAKFAQMSSRYATARQQILLAHQFNPADPDIRWAWLQTLPLKERLSELDSYLQTPTGQDPDELHHLHFYQDHLKRLASEPQKPCHLVSSTQSTEIPFVKLMYNQDRVRGFGLNVEFNHTSTHLQIDTGAGGLLLYRDAAQRAGIKRFSETSVGGIGDKGEKRGYTAFADSIRIGNLEFQNCSVQVIDANPPFGDDDGLIGLNVFSQFLVTLDYPMRKVMLGPLPSRPDETLATQPVLKTDANTSEDSEAEEGSSAKTVADHQSAAAKPVAQGPHDRYISPDMSDYTPIYRIGHYLMVPTGMNGKAVKLFVLDTGSWTTIVAPDAARQVTKLTSGNRYQASGLNGTVDKLYTADEITFNFAHMAQTNRELVSFDLTKISKNIGTEVSGLLGATTLKLLIMHIDYRDGLVKFEYIPDRGYKF